jgi:hypothetical protein
MKLKKGTAMYCDELIVVGNGRLTYVWVGKDGTCVCNFGGEAMLRKLRDQLTKALNRKNRRRKGATA